MLVGSISSSNLSIVTNVSLSKQNKEDNSSAIDGIKNETAMDTLEIAETGESKKVHYMKYHPEYKGGITSDGVSDPVKKEMEKLMEGYYAG